MYFGVVTSRKIFFSFISTSSLPCVQRFFSKINKQTNPKNRKESPKEGLDDTIFQYFVDELKLGNPGICVWT